MRPGLHAAAISSQSYQHVRLEHGSLGANQERPPGAKRGAAVRGRRGASSIYVSIEPDYDYDDGWIVYVTWEVPAPNGEEWPLEVLDRYWQRTRDTVGDAGTAHCLFRTPDEMSEPGHQRGALLQPA